MDPAAFELLALRMAEFELMSRCGVNLPNPLTNLEQKHPDIATGFYWGLLYEIAIPETTRGIVENNLDAYAAGVLARELIHDESMVLQLTEGSSGSRRHVR